VLISLAEYVDSPHLSRRKCSVYCRSFRVGVPPIMSAVIGHLEKQTSNDIWSEVIMSARLHMGGVMTKEQSLNCIMAFALQRVVEGYALNRLLRASNPWGTSQLTGKETGHTVSVPNFLLDASDKLLGIGWKNLYAGAQIDKVANNIKAKHMCVTKKRLEVLFFDKLLHLLIPSNYKYIKIDV